MNRLLILAAILSCCGCTKIPTHSVYVSTNVQYRVDTNSILVRINHADGTHSWIVVVSKTGIDPIDSNR